MTDGEFDPTQCDETDRKIIALINVYPIPNTIEDIVEFMHLAVGNINIRKSKTKFLIPLDRKENLVSEW